MSLENQEKNIGFVYFMTERDLFGYPCGPYVKVGLVKGNDDGRSSFDRRKTTSQIDIAVSSTDSINKKILTQFYFHTHQEKRKE